MSKKSTIYLDNNGTTARCRLALEELVKWSSEPFNASTTSKYGLSATKMIENATNTLKKHCDAQNYSIIFTSGASESNSMILRSVAEAFKFNKKMIPHIITSATEHGSILDCCSVMEKYGLATYTAIEPDIRGCISAKDVEKAIKTNTAIISIIGANNELGCINNIKEIGKIAHKNRVPFHSDFVQLFGKFKISLQEYNVDAISVSFHKFGGPIGCGLLMVNNNLIKGYGLMAQIHGTQQMGLRGGTQNVPAIASSIIALKQTFIGRNEKNKKLLAMKHFIITELAKSIPFADYATYLDSTAKHRPVEFVLLGQTDSAKSLPNTILLSVAKNEGKPFCNVILKKELEKNDVVVSIGSACNTKSKNASHVIEAIRAPPVIKRGIIRISLCDSNTKAELVRFVSIYLNSVGKQISF